MSIVPVTRHYTGRSWVNVVRGDYIPGGLKSLAIEGVFTRTEKEFLVFGSNSHGFGPVAVTINAVAAGKTPVLFLSKHDKMSPNLEFCKAQGALLHFAGNSDVTDSQGLIDEATQLYDNTTHEILPFGLNCPEVAQNMRELIRGFSDHTPEESWVTVASGAIWGAMADVWPLSQRNGVIVKNNAEKINPRGSQFHIASEAFIEPAKSPPPFKSCPELDGKLWQFLVTRNCSKDTLVINVA